MVRRIALVGMMVAVSGCADGWVYTRGPAFDSFADRAAAENHSRATVEAAETARTGTPVSWTSPKGALGSVTPTGESFSDAVGRTCRHLKQEVTVQSVTRSREAEACRLTDGTWIIVDKAI